MLGSSFAGVNQIEPTLAILTILVRQPIYRTDIDKYDIKNVKNRGYEILDCSNIILPNMEQTHIDSSPYN